jgi:hypothetical protein
MVESEDVVIYEAFDEIEEAPPEECPTKEGSSAARPSPLSRPSPKQPNPDDYTNPGTGVEEAIGKGVVLEDLVEEDPVHEPSEADADQYRGRSRPYEALVRVLITH